MKLNLLFVAVLLLPYRADAGQQDAKAQQLLQQMQATYANAKTMTATTMTREYVEKNGTRSLNRTVRENLEAQRPSSFRVDSTSEKPGQAPHKEEAVSNGASVWNYDAQAHQYIKTSVDSPLTAITAAAGGPGAFFLHPQRLEDIAKPNPLITLRYAGREKIASVECDKVEVHLASPVEGVPSSVQTYYIGPNHLLRRLTSQMKFAHQLSFTAIDVQTKVLDRKIPDLRFVFTPPPGATQKELPDIPGAPSARN